MQRWHRVTVARYQDRLQEQARRLVDGEWIPRESRTENVRGAQRGKKIIENYSDRGGDQERRHRGNRRFTSVKQVSGSYHRQEHWQSDVNEHSSVTKTVAASTPKERNANRKASLIRVLSSPRDQAARIASATKLARPRNDSKPKA